MNLFFIDQLFMQQDYPEGNLPFVGELKLDKTMLETGELLPSTVTFKQHEGSFSSSLKVVSNGTRVRIEGNPSRWERKDNLIGFYTLDECVAVYNSVLLSLGLPPFTKLTRIWHRASTGDGKKSGLVSDGAEITQIDFTKNHVIGEGGEQSFIRGMSSVCVGRSMTPHLYPNGYSCDWGQGSTWIMCKLYCKWHEMELRLKDKLKKNCKKPLSSEEIKYREKLISYCKSLGVVREEHSLRQSLLKRYRLNFYGLGTEAEFLPHLTKLSDAMKTTEISHDEHLPIAVQLVNAGAVGSIRTGNTTQNYFNSWQMGEDLRTVLKPTQFKEHKRRLKTIGIDIGLKFDVTRMCPTLVKSELINISPFIAPPWYEHAMVPTLLRVAS